MNWSPLDQVTQERANNYPVFEQGIIVPAAQFNGHNFNPDNWRRRVIQAEWPNGLQTSSPGAIMLEFQNGRYLQGVALVVSWGGMRRSSRIWNSPLGNITQILQQCAMNIQQTQSIMKSWTLMTEQLSWSAVMASKTLHFLCRALGFQQDPPVPIDNAIIRMRLWRDFVHGILYHQRPGNWQGDSLEAYLRYMTAIRVWANQRRWTTTEIETTIFAQYHD